MSSDKPFPVLGGPLDCPTSVPWSLVAPHERQAMANHGGQTLARLAERGGLSPTELFAVCHDMPWRFGLQSVGVEWLRGLNNGAGGADQ